MRKARVLKIDRRNPEKEGIELAAEILKKGGLVAVSTETVYGLGANLRDKKAVNRLYRVKNRPKNKPLTIHIAGMDTVERMAGDISPIVRKLMNRFWPGPLTLILESKKGKPVGFRMPSGSVARSLIEASGVPVVMPSANISGERPPTSAEDVIKSFENKIDMVLDSGPTEFGVESTIIDTTVFPYRVLREGAITKSQIKDAWHYE